MVTDAAQFKTAFEDAQKSNVNLISDTADGDKDEEKDEENETSEGEDEKNKE